MAMADGTPPTESSVDLVDASCRQKDTSLRKCSKIDLVLENWAHEPDKVALVGEIIALCKKLVTTDKGSNRLTSKLGNFIYQHVPQELHEQIPQEFIGYLRKFSKYRKEQDIGRLGSDASIDAWKKEANAASTNNDGAFKNKLPNIKKAMGEQFGNGRLVQHVGGERNYQHLLGQVNLRTLISSRPLFITSEGVVDELPQQDTVPALHKSVTLNNTFAGARTISEALLMSGHTIQAFTYWIDGPTPRDIKKSYRKVQASKRHANDPTAASRKRARYEPPPTQIDQGTRDPDLVLLRSDSRSDHHGLVPLGSAPASDPGWDAVMTQSSVSDGVQVASFAPREQHFVSFEHLLAPGHPGNNHLYENGGVRTNPMAGAEPMGVLQEPVNTAGAAPANSRAIQAFGAQKS
ncbi:hypothetical protein KC330_g7914 [Hortaea werneckii]|nr:hypothetical protein KC330_g7914 [Hortaea werneckii]